MRKIIASLAMIMLIGVCPLQAGYAADAAPAASEAQQKQQAMDQLEHAYREALGKTGAGLSAAGAVDPEVAGKVQPGDLVKIDYTVTLENGNLVLTTVEKTAMDKGRAKADGYRETGGFAPQEIVAGKPAPVPGIGDAVLGMSTGGKKRVTLAPEQAFGVSEPSRMAKFPVEKQMPRTIRVPAGEYAKKFESFPVKDKEVNLVPYFKSRVTEVTETDVVLEFIVKDGEKFKEPFGEITVKADKDTIRLVLTPVVGSDFEIQGQGQKGRISVSDGTTFTVDFNHPLAGKNVVADIEVLSIVKASSLRDRQLSWIEDYDRAFEESRKQGRPVVLVLYADWCSWCKKLLNETAADPRITTLRDRFVWAKVNSDKLKEIGSKYGQKGFPLTVVVSPGGKIVSKIDGYRDAAALRAELEKALAGS